MVVGVWARGGWVRCVRVSSTRRRARLVTKGRLMEARDEGPFKRFTEYLGANNGLLARPLDGKG